MAAAKRKNGKSNNQLAEQRSISIGMAAANSDSEHARKMVMDGGNTRSGGVGISITLFQHSTVLWLQAQQNKNRRGN